MNPPVLAASVDVGGLNSNDGLSANFGWLLAEGAPNPPKAGLSACFSEPDEVPPRMEANAWDDDDFPGEKVDFLGSKQMMAILDCVLEDCAVRVWGIVAYCGTFGRLKRPVKCRVAIRV